MIHVRKAEPADVPWLVEQMRAFSEFYGTKKPLCPSDPATVRRLLYAMIEGTSFVFWIAEFRSRTGEWTDTPYPVGFMAGSLGVHPYNPEIRTLTEMFWWVVPEYRGSWAGAKLLKQFTDHGEKNADWVVMTLEKDSPVDPKSLEKRGYKEHERSYLLEVA